MSSIAPPPHTRTARTSDDWITPKWLVDRLTLDLGPFDLDPCESDSQPWAIGRQGIRRTTGDGLLMAWEGEVWLNPPYGRATHLWLDRLATHGNGLALIFARTDTAMFFRHVWPRATAVLFLRGRLTFCYPDGTGSKAGHNSGGPSCLVAYGPRSTARLASIADLGALCYLKAVGTHARAAASTAR